MQGQFLEHHGRLLGVVDRAQHVGQFGVGHHAGQAVAGQEEPVSGADVQDAEVFGAAPRVLAAQVEVKDVLELVSGQLLPGDRSRVEQGVGQGVVLGQLLEMALAQAVGPGIADARDVDPILAELGQDHGRAHVRVFGDQPGAAEDLRVHLGDGLADRLLDMAWAPSPRLRAAW